jgi:hypothetical protein
MKFLMFPPDWGLAPLMDLGVALSSYDEDYLSVFVGSCARVSNGAPKAN